MPPVRTSLSGLIVTLLPPAACCGGERDYTPSWKGVTELAPDCCVVAGLLRVFSEIPHILSITYPSAHHPAPQSLPQPLVLSMLCNLNTELTQPLSELPPVWIWCPTTFPELLCLPGSNRTVKLLKGAFTHIPDGGFHHGYTTLLQETGSFPDSHLHPPLCSALPGSVSPLTLTDSPSSLSCALLTCRSTHV